MFGNDEMSWYSFFFFNLPQFPRQDTENSRGSQRVKETLELKLTKPKSDVILKSLCFNLVWISKSDSREISKTKTKNS